MTKLQELEARIKVIEDRLDIRQPVKTKFKRGDIVIIDSPRTTCFNGEVAEVIEVFDSSWGERNRINIPKSCGSINCGATETSDVYYADDELIFTGLTTLNV